MNVYEEAAHQCDEAKSHLELRHRKNYEEWEEQLEGPEGEAVKALEKARELLLRVLWERQELKKLAEELRKKPKGIWGTSDEFRNGMKLAYGNAAQALHARIFQFDLDAKS